MRRALRLAALVVATLWVLALAIWVIGTFGLFGQPKDPLSAVFLVLAGLPWSLALDVAPEAARPILGALAPGLTVTLLLALARRG